MRSLHMTGREVLEAVAIYRRYFRDNNIGKIDFPHDELNDSGVSEFARLATLEHCHGMLDQMERMVAENTPGKMEKVFRWVGFIQGCLWSQGIYCLDELKQHNRS